MALHLCLRKLKHRKKLTLGNRQDCKTEKGNLDSAPVGGVMWSNDSPYVPRKWDNKVDILEI